MLNFNVAMLIKRHLLYLFLLAAAGFLGGWQTVPQPMIAAPLPGEAVQGIVPITGSTAIDGFISAEISFGYMVNTTQTWFLLAESQTPESNGQLFPWDTTRIPDGNYQLRLQVFTNDGRVIEQVIEGVRVRNYSLVETNTPTLEITKQETPLPGTPTVEMLIATATPAQVLQTATSLPPNPAELNESEFLSSMKWGAISVIALLLLVGLFLSARYFARRR